MIASATPSIRGRKTSPCDKGSFQERKSTMRNSIVGKILMALLFASLISALSAGPALARNGDRDHGPAPRGYYDDRGRQWDHGRRVYRPQGYYRPGPRYGPPIYPVPVPSPGVSLFCPSRSTFDRESSTSIPDCSRPPYSVPPGAIGLERINARRLN